MKKMKLGRYIDPLTDFGFKYIFGSQPNKELLIAFLNAVFRGKKIIVDVEYGPTEQSSDSSLHRGVTVDLFCTGDKGEHFIVEMQRCIQAYFKDRSLFYTSRVISRQEKKGDSKWDYQLPEVYFIGIMDFRFQENEREQYFHDVRLIERETGKEFYDKLGLIYIELPNFTKTFTDASDMEGVSLLDKWIYTLKEMGRLNKEPEFLNEWIFERIFKIAEVVNLKDKELMEYEVSLKAQRDYSNSLAYVEKKALERGKEEGRLEGKQEGRLEGKQEGKIETKTEVVKNLIVNYGFSNEQISDMVNVTIEFVEKIRREINGE